MTATDRPFDIGIFKFFLTHFQHVLTCMSNGFKAIFCAMVDENLSYHLNSIQGQMFFLTHYGMCTTIPHLLDHLFPGNVIKRRSEHESR